MHNKSIDCIGRYVSGKDRRFLSISWLFSCISVVWTTKVHCFDSGQGPGGSLSRIMHYFDRLLSELIICSEKKSAEYVPGFGIHTPWCLSLQMHYRPVAQYGHKREKKFWKLEKRMTLKINVWKTWGLSGTVMWSGSSPFLKSNVNHLIGKKLPAVRAAVSSLGKVLKWKDIYW